MNHINLQHIIFRYILLILCALSVASCSDTVTLNFTGLTTELIDFNDCHNHHRSDNVPDYIVANRLCIAVTPIFELIEDAAYQTSEDSDNPLVNPVIDIRIYTIYPLSAEYPAGSLVNDAFGLVDAINMSRPIPWPDKGDKEAYITHTFFPPDTFIFAIRKPVAEGPAQFRVEFEMADGRVLSSLSPVATIYQP